MKNWFALLILSLSCLVALSGQEKFRRLPPYPDPVAEWRLPRLESAVLANGLTVAVVPRRNSTFISLQLLVFAGESASPENLPGLATLTAQLLSRGTLLLSAADIEDKVEAFGGELTITTSFDHTLLSLRCLDDRLDEALSLLSQMILQPSFPNSELDAVRRLLFYDLLEKSQDPDFLARRQLLRLLFQGHPYERALFNEDVLRRISRRDVEAFYTTFYRPDNAVLVLGGNVTLSLASRKVSHYLNTWAREEARRIASPGLAAREERVLGFIDLPQSREATVAMGKVVFSRPSSDIFPFMVLNQVFGGSPHSRLFMNLRETHQYAYFAFSEIELFQNGGVFFIRAKFPPGSLSAGIREIERELGRLLQEKIPTAEIEQAKSYLIGSYPLDLEPLEAMTRRAAEVLAFQMEEDHWNRLVENLLTVDASRVFEVGRKTLSLPLSVIIVGDSRLIGGGLKDFDQVRVYDRKGQFQYTISKGEEK